MRGIRITNNGKYATYGTYRGNHSLGTYETLREARDVVSGYYKSVFDKNIYDLGIGYLMIEKIPTLPYYVVETGVVLNKFGEIMVGRIDRCGYHTITLCEDGNCNNYSTHRLVLSILNPHENMDVLDVNHIDGIKTNNELSNLEWCTRSENVKHSFSNGLQTNIGNQYGKFKVATDDDICEMIRLRDTGLSYVDVGKVVGFSGKTVSKYYNRGGRY